MRTVTTRQLRSLLPQLDAVLAQEGEVLITRRGKPIARVLALRETGKPSHDDLRARMPRAAQGSEVFVREDRDER